MALRVGFDGRDLLRKRTGVTNYTRYLGQELARDESLELLLYLDGYRETRTGDDQRHGTTPTSSRTQPGVLGAWHSPPEQKTIPLPREGARGWGARTLRAPGPLWKHAALPLALLADRAALFHSPTGTLPWVAPCPGVVTIHDLFADVGPEWFPPGLARRLSTLQRRAARAARAVIAVSENTRRDVIERYGVSPERVYVVHNGVDHDRFQPPVGSLSGAEGGDEGVSGVLQARYGIRQPFVLCVGSLMPWRNAPRLLRAVAAARERHGLHHDLLFVGRDIWGTDPTARLALERGWTDWARFSGYVEDEDLPALYAAADVFAYPSLYEGFGIPPLEAMATGTPVVVSTAGSLPEVVGDAALLVDPVDEDQLAEAIVTAAIRPEIRQKLRAAGLKRAAQFTWPRAAHATAGVYHAAVQS